MPTLKSSNRDLLFSIHQSSSKYLDCTDRNIGVPSGAQLNAQFMPTRMGD
jgi:hypothetical protein